MNAVWEGCSGYRHRDVRIFSYDLQILNHLRRFLDFKKALVYRTTKLSATFKIALYVPKAELQCGIHLYHSLVCLSQ